jgi:menaquinone-9 beta-reductase
MQSEILIIGGGLAGLSAACNLRLKGYAVTLIEKKDYPAHKVCGEYVSFEAKPYLESLGIDLNQSKTITKFSLSSPSGLVYATELPLGGMGISRFLLDQLLYQRAISLGAKVITQTEVVSVDFQDDSFTASDTNQNNYTAKVVLAAFGKRSKLDAVWNRSFFKTKSPWIGVKYHIKYPFSPDTIALHNFKDGYCGISMVENDTHCLCYLANSNLVKKYGSIPAFEQAIVHKNPFLKDIFTKAKFLYQKPLVINEVSFSKKEAVFNHALNIGDSAGLISPLCGNGMAMAFHAGLLACSQVDLFLKNQQGRQQMEANYTKNWKDHFEKRLWFGRIIQRLFGDIWQTEAVMWLLTKMPFLGQWLIKQTHGKVF